MKIISFFRVFASILIILGIFSVSSVSANAPKCPFPYKVEITSDAVLSKIQECMVARGNNTTQTITEYNCLAGDFTSEDDAPITNERLSAHIATNLIMNEVDKKMTEYMKSLQQIRSKDTTAWIAEYNSCIKENNNRASLEDFYASLCQFRFVADFLNNNNEKKTIIATSDAFPQRMCQEMAMKNVKKWQFAAENLMVAGVSKSYQNDRDRYMEGNYGKYYSIIAKFHNYQKILFRAASKMTHYIQEAVK